MNYQEIISQLQDLSSMEYKKNVVKMGIPEDNCLGVSSSELKKLAKKVKKSNELANQLWCTQYHEAKLLAVLLYDPKTISFHEIQSMICDVQSWDLCNFLCKNLITKVKGYECLIPNWVQSNAIYVKRAAFVLMASHIIYDPNISNSIIEQYLIYIEQYSQDHRVHVRKAIAYALKEIGKKNFNYNEKAILLAYDLINSNSKDQQWIGKNALKELENLVEAKGRKRLISSRSQMGQL